MRQLKKVLLAIGILLIAYGYFARLSGIFFFWESRYVGFLFLVLGVVLFLSERITMKRRAARRTLLEKIGIGILLFLFVLQCALFIIFPSTEAYNIATSYIKTNSEVQDKIGNVSGISMVPKGSFTMTTLTNEAYGEAEFYFILKGSRKFADALVVMKKDAGSDWTVTRFKMAN